MNDSPDSDAGSTGPLPAERSRSCTSGGSAAPAAGDALAADDPQGVLRDALSMPADAAAADIVLGWLLRLPGGNDPAGAAARILAARDAGPAGNEDLVHLLAEVARWPAARLNGLPRRRLA